MFIYLQTDYWAPTMSDCIALVAIAKKNTHRTDKIMNYKLLSSIEHIKGPQIHELHGYVSVSNSLATNY